MQRQVLSQVPWRQCLIDCPGKTGGWVCRSSAVKYKTSNWIQEELSKKPELLKIVSGYHERH